MPYTQLNNLGFTEIKTALKEYMRAQTDFTDYDFDGSVLSNLLDVLAYNTYYTAFNTNMVVNELFLDSATLRDNVVSIAKQLGYTPKSITAASAVIDFNVNIPNNPPEFIVLKKGTGFITNYDDSTYQFVVREDTRAEVANGIASFSSIDLTEGTLVTTRTVVDSTLKSQKFQIDNPSADLNTLEVHVFQSSGSTISNVYKRVDNILDPSITKDAKVFFVNEINDERYEVIFGDGSLGRKLDDGEVVEINYVKTSGKVVNGARTFQFAGVFQDNTSVVSVPYTVNNVVTVSKAAGGADIESVEKIKYLAPKYFSSQNRAVTGSDYEVIARNVYPAISDIIVFGGEDQVPPAYGKVFLAIKPADASFLSQFTKRQIEADLKQYSVGSVRPVLVDPSILYVELTSKVYYDGGKTNLLPRDVGSKVSQAITEYLKTSDTEKFNGKFRYSKFVGVIDDADRAINSNLTEVTLRKDFYAQLNATSYYEICYQNEFLTDCDDPVVSSSGFVTLEYPNYTVYLEDRSGKIVLYRLDALTGEKIVLNNAIGDIDYAHGEIKMYDLTIIQGSFSDNRIELRVKPASDDVSVLREAYLDVDVAKSKFVAYKE
nr:baseplate wedge subunit [uncultured Mediterranean phage uvMED]BAR27735.1 baseplate wedge subunit [uncultured Mediterranean phage uvMED]BAR39524.1 baseplate wedge subunit [uncultured Mediterranean phage uvMED]|tara:strand:- start:47515 stop:49320 length:1806 start_codon:yes stop_codon:yes gene_type:complete